MVLFSSAAAGVMATRTAAPTRTTTADPGVARARAEITSRFFEIMTVRQKALVQRNARVLRTIYTPDSPNLRADRAEIQVLRSKHERWVGLQLPVQVLKVTEVSSGDWTVVALLGRSDARLELESGKLIRDVDGNRQVYWCTLIKDPARGWVLYRFVPP